MSSGWTEEQVNMLMDLSKQGIADSEIAERLQKIRPGVTDKQLRSCRFARGFSKRHMNKHKMKESKSEVVIPTTDNKCSDKLMKVLGKINTLMKREGVNKITITSSGDINIQWFHTMELTLGR